MGRKDVLYEMIRELVVSSRVEELGEIAVRHAEKLLGTRVAVLALGPGDEYICVAGAKALAGDKRVLTVPMMGTRDAVGAFVLRKKKKPIKRSRMRTFETMVAQTALAIERAQLASEAERAHVAAESERTRNTLLAGLSHDLRTPLLSIGGSAGVLLDPNASLDDQQRRALLTTVRDEAQKLTRLVTGLLDLVHIESGKVQVFKEWYPLEEILSSALVRLERALDGRAVKTRLGSSSELLMVAADPILVEQVFFNLLDNAAKYTPAGSGIEILAEADKDHVRVDIIDEGRGISPGDERRVFEKFYRSEKSSMEAQGAGLGLALCEAIVRAHGGRIEARRGNEKGSIFSVYLPADVQPRIENELAREVIA